MNKVILMGRLTRDPEVRYSQSNDPLAVAKFSIAVDRKFKRDNEPAADFINCVAFGKQGELIEKFFKKGMMVSVVGRMQVQNYEDASGQKKVYTDVVIEDFYFAESKAAFESRMSNAPRDEYQSQERSQTPPKQNNKKPQNMEPEGFYPIDEGMDDDDLPF